MIPYNKLIIFMLTLLNVYNNETLSKGIEYNKFTINLQVSFWLFNEYDLKMDVIYYDL